MLGCPGTRKVVVVWAWVKTPTKAEMNDAPYPNMHFDENNKERLQNWKTYGPTPDSTRDHWLAWLDSGGRNKFEACLRLDHNKKVKLYAPGFGAFDTADQVLKNFGSMSWFDGDQKKDTIVEY